MSWCPYPQDLNQGVSLPPQDLNNGVSLPSRFEQRVSRDDGTSHDSSVFLIELLFIGVRYQFRIPFFTAADSSWLLILCHKAHDFQLEMHHKVFGNRELIAIPLYRPKLDLWGGATGGGKERREEEGKEGRAGKGNGRDALCIASNLNCVLISLIWCYAWCLKSLDEGECPTSCKNGTVWKMSEGKV